jgi:FMN phosphatase YigB (HAD superfamily)
MKLTGIRFIAWDFDGTLYHINGSIWSDIFEAQYKVIHDMLGWDREKAAAEHAKVYRVVTQSSTDAVARICNISIAQAVLATEEYYDRTKYVSYDAELVRMFRRLSVFTHIMFVNGKKEREEPALRKLGVNPSIFRTWITPEQTQTVKPDPLMAKALRAYTGVAPSQILVVGDREDVDLRAAHDMGMKTCLVWSQTPGAIADCTLTDVYQVPDILE